MSDLVDTAVRRWLDAALLLSCAGRAPRDALGWLGTAWIGAAAVAYERWAGSFELASRRAADALREAARELREQRLDPHRVEAAGREMRAVPLPGDRPPRDHPRPPEPPQPTDLASDQASDQAEPTPEPTPQSTTDRSGTVGDWIDQARTILLRHGYRPEQLDPDDIATIIKHESSGNPNAVNNWDANAARGTPSMGLMQTIRPTFERYNLPGHDDILNPVDNIIAGVRYAVARYGSVSRTPGVVSLAAGGDYRGY